jgi:glucuronokinase
MHLIRKRAYARAGLVGNPSDGYGGRTISVIVRNFWAEVVLYEWEDVEIILSLEDRCSFRSVKDLVHDVKLHGYYGGIRLVKATIKRFVEYCHRHGIPLHGRNFSVRYETNIPRQVGLAGSSAIIVATLRCLTDFYEVEIPREVQPSLVLSVETEELGITAGLQDRVAQVYEGAVFMDFSSDQMHRFDGYVYGRYEPLDPGLLPGLYVAYNSNVSEPTEVVHNNLRARYDQGDPDVRKAMSSLADLVLQAKAAIFEQDSQRLARIIDTNFDLRRTICRIPAGQLELVERARSVGVSAKFAGSGGAIIGVCPNEATFRRLKATLEPNGCVVIRPEIDLECNHAC